ncbi:MAG: chromosome segregation protein SMC [Nitrospirae bacterium]|nr:chromosome segregation protein SMC [Nitrospirota bacterium]
MHVERIELNGFKSFCDRTVLHMHEGITAVVGPNGCGKSNVVDAFKWVLGEQSAKSLRGGSMEDVIFFGSSARKSKGMAEVMLVLSGVDELPSQNPDGNGGAGAAEVTVTRRLYRSGESEYLLNKVPCRLKDIKDILLDTGLELKAYSILEQGRINHILNSKPEERRFLIEEAAGVMKYKVRKSEALRKLEASKFNLQRLSDIISEIKRQINAIDRHAKKAERYKKLFEEIRAIDLKIANRELSLLRDELSALASSENELKEKEAQLSAKIHSSEALIQEKRRLCVDSEKKLGEARSARHALEREVAEEEGEAALLRRDCENLKERIANLAEREKESFLLREEASAQLAKTEADSREIIKNLSDLGSILEEKKRALVSAEEEISLSESSLEAERRGLFSKAEEISSIRNEISRVSVMISNLKQKAEKSSVDITAVRGDLTSLEDIIGSTRKACSQAVASLNETKEHKEKAVSSLSDKKNEMASSETLLYGERETLAALISKHESLKEIYASRKADLDGSVRVLSQISDTFETSPEYETAIEAILGDKLNASVVGSHEDLLNALNHIKQKNGKRSGFVSAEDAETYIADAAPEPLPKAGGSGSVIGRALDFIRVKEEFKNIASLMLSDVWLVDNIETALSCRSSSASNYYVTLDGEVVEPSGIVFAGTEKGVLRTKRNLKELEADISKTREAVSASEGLVKKLRDDISKIENEIIAINGETSEKEKFCHELQVKISAMEEENARHVRKLEFLSIEADEGRGEKESLQKALDEKSALCEVRESEKKSIEERIIDLQNGTAEKRALLERLRSELTEIRLEQTSINEKTASYEREKRRLEAAVADIDRKKAGMIKEMSGMEGLILQKEDEAAEIEETLRSKVTRIDKLAKEVSVMEEILLAKNAEVGLIEKQEKAYASEIEAVRKELGHTEVRKTESSMRYDYLREDMRKAYAVDIISNPIEGELSPEEEERLPGLREKIEELGQVNLGSLEEYEELKTRYDFMTKQQEDVVDSITSLEETIFKINRSTKQRLREAFDALNEKFKEVFAILFGNGNAELILTHEDILEAGIDIVAQPPGKRLKNLMALSGGEQALTTLSLLFAGFLVKPTPVCILDEVDAPLDESNTGKFLSLLSEMSKKIQFIAITHNRLTMEAADFIYGITMEEPGASKAVSMQMADVA